MRDRSADGKIVEFPRGDSLRLERAIEAFDAGDQSHELFKQFEALAERNVREAYFFLGCMYEDGSNGVPMDKRAALASYERTIEEFGYVEGYLGAARLLYHGDGVEQDFGQAFRYYEHVARNHGHPVACFMLGRMHQYGQGTEKDPSAARSWYGRAVSHGSVFGILNLAMLEADEGRILKSLCMRIRASVLAFAIGRRNPKDIRLRGG